MNSAPFLIKALDTTDNRSTFNSGVEPLDRYLREQVTQDIRRRITACFIALTDKQQIAGYYTLASSSMLLADLPTSTSKKLPRYPTVPTVRMGRLAVDQAFRGQGLGAALLYDALHRTARSEIATYALTVDAKDDAATAFYLHHGFIALPDLSRTLFIPLAAITATPLHKKE